MHIHTYLSHLIQIFFLSTPGKILHIPFWVLSPQIHKKKIQRYVSTTKNLNRTPSKKSGRCFETYMAAWEQLIVCIYEL